MTTIYLDNIYGKRSKGHAQDDLNKKTTLTGNVCFCPSCQKEQPTIKSRYENKPAERCGECGKMLIPK